MEYRVKTKDECLANLPCVSPGKDTGLPWPSFSSDSFSSLLPLSSNLLLPSSVSLTSDFSSASTIMMWPVLLPSLSSVSLASPKFWTGASSLTLPSVLGLTESPSVSELWDPSRASLTWFSSVSINPPSSAVGLPSTVSRLVSVLPAGSLLGVLVPPSWIEKTEITDFYGSSPQSFILLLNSNWVHFSVYEPQ